MSQHEITDKGQTRELAAKLFNEVWDLLDNPQRSKDEDLQMIHSAHASRRLWGDVGGEKELATGEWQISRVYAVLKMAQSAMLHGQASLQHCEKGQLSPFDFGFAYEAIARAFALQKREGEKYLYITRAREMSAKVEEAADRDYLLQEIEHI